MSLAQSNRYLLDVWAQAYTALGEAALPPLGLSPADIDAVLTVEPGTTILMEPAGFLSVAGSGDNAALVAVGTAAEPITFTSAALDPAPGDWQCVRIGADSSATDIRFTTFEYGGAPCAATGADRPDAATAATARLLARMRVLTVFMGVSGKSGLVFRALREPFACCTARLTKSFRF